MARRSRLLFRQRRSFASRMAKSTGIAVIVTAVLVAVFFLTLPWTTTLALRQFLNARGWGPAVLHVTQIDLRGIEVRDVSLAGGAITLAHARITYDPKDLAAGRIDAIAVDKLAIKAALTENGFTVGPWHYVGTETTAMPGLPLRRITVADSRFTVAVGANEIVTDLVFDLSQENGQWQGQLTAHGAAGHGGALIPFGKLAWQGSLAWPDFTTAAGKGALDLSATALALSDDVTLSAHGHLEFTTGDGQAALTAPDHIAVNLSSIPALLSESTDGWMKRFAAGVAIEAGGTKGGGPSLIWRDENGAATQQADVDFTAIAGNTVFHAVLRGKAGGMDQGLPTTVAIDDFRVDATRLPSPFGELTGRVRIANVAGPLLTAAGNARFEAAIVKPQFGAFTAGTVVMVTDTRFRVDGETIAFTPQTLSVTTTNAAIGGISAPGETVLALAGSRMEPQAITAVFGMTGDPTLTFGLSTAVHGLRLLPGSNGGSAATTFTVELPDLRFEGYLVPGTGSYDIALRSNDATLSSPRADLRFGAFSTRLYDGNGDGDGTTQVVRLWGDPLQGRPRVPGMMLTYKFHIDDQIIDFKSNIMSGKSQDLGRVMGQISERDGSGHFSLDLPHLVFGDGTLDASDVFSGAFPISALTGKIDIALKTAWGTKAASSARVALDNVGFRASSVAVNGVATDFYLTSLSPLKAAGSQHITAASVIAGIPFKDLAVEATLAGDGNLALSGGAAAAGGKASLANVQIPLDDFASTTLPLTLSKLRLETLTTQAEVDGLSATGSLSGVLPVRFTGQVLRVESGQIKSDVPGTVTYLPKSPPAALTSAGEIVLKALSNFQYESIGATINGDLLKDLRVNLAMKGRNPDLHDGYPISFRLNLSGPLGNILGGGVTGYKLDPETIPLLDRNATPDGSVNNRPN